MMSYSVVFYCGAEIEVETSPRRTLRVVVHSSRTGGARPKMPDGNAANCHGCRCRRASGRQEYQCFPPDYDRDSILPGGKYDGKRFTQFCERVIACFPKTVRKVAPAKEADDEQEQDRVG